MATKSVLIIGGSGFVGTQLALRLRETYKVYATYHHNPVSIPGVTFLPFNIENRTWVKRIVYMSVPDVVIYCAGSNDLRWAEKNQRGAERLHTVGPATVASATDVLQPKFILLSNSFLFDGHRGNYHEGDTVLPESSLGKAKLGGENQIRGKSLNYLIVRSAPLFGRGNGYNLSYFDKLRTSLARKKQVEAATDEIHNFAPISGFLDMMERLIETGIKNKVIHYGGLTKVSNYEFAQTFAQRFGFDPGLVLPMANNAKKLALTGESSIQDYSLNSSFMVENLKLKPLLLEEGFDLIEKQLVVRS